jgi:hypothetical protein
MFGREIEIIRGGNRVLLVAPHGFPDDDENTGRLTREIAGRLGSYALINEHYRKPKKNKRDVPDKQRAVLNLNRCNQVEKHLRDEFLRPLVDFVQEIGGNHGPALVFWIHGIKDNNIENAVGNGHSTDIHVAVGAGQGNPDRWTARKDTTLALLESLRKTKLRPIHGALALRGSDYCGRHPNIMNQYFLRRSYQHTSVESIQLEIKYTGFRDKHLQDAAAAFAEALAPFALLTAR